MCPGAWVMTRGRSAEVAARVSGDSAGPETGNLAGEDTSQDLRNRGLSDPGNTDFFRRSHMDGSPVSQMKARGDLYGTDGLCRFHGAHTHHQRGDENGPAGMQVRLVMYMLTLLSSSRFRTGTPAFRRALSKEKLHPKRKLTIFSWAIS